MDVQRKAQCAAGLVIAMLLGLAMDADAADPRDRSGQVSSPAASPSMRSDPTIAPRPAPADLTSRSAFDAWRARHHNAATPLDALSPGGRERLIDSMGFGPDGIGGLGVDDLARELDQTQIDAILAWLSLDAGLVRSSRDGAAAADGDAGARRVEPNAAITDTERRANAFLRDIRGDAGDEAPSAREARVASLYDAAFPTLTMSRDLKALADADLLLLLRVGRQAADAGHPRAVDDLQGLLPTLQARGIASYDDLQDVQNTLLRARRFDAARILHDANPHVELDRIPALRDAVSASSMAPTAWRLRDGGAVLECERIALAGTRIVVTAGCHFSQDAAADIATDPVLGAAFARHATWLMPAPGGESIDAVLDWNRRFPQAQALMRHDDAEWSLLPSFSMPTFYVIRNGRVIERVTGWSSHTKEQRQPLIDALSRSGLPAD